MSMDEPVSPLRPFEPDEPSESNLSDGGGDDGGPSDASTLELPGVNTYLLKQKVQVLEKNLQVCTAHELIAV